MATEYRFNTETLEGYAGTAGDIAADLSAVITEYETLQSHLEEVWDTSDTAAAKFKIAMTEELAQLKTLLSDAESFETAITDSVGVLKEAESEISTLFTQLLSEIQTISSVVESY